MNRRFASLALGTLLLAACHTAQTQGPGPQVVVVPPDELSREPSMGPATSAASPTPQEQSPQPAPPTGDTIFVSKPGNPAPSQKLSYTQCHVSGPYIAMTFDDGPDPERTPKLLDMLKERGIKATFFVVGQNAAQYPDILRRMAAEGHEIGNHSWSHPALTKLGANGVANQLNQTSDAIEKATGQRPATMRPPYGATNASLNQRINSEFGMKVILWSVDPLDWRYRNSTRVMNQILQGAQPGAIILAHDIHPTTVAAMPQTFDALLAKGYKFVTVSELLAMDRPPQMAEKAAATPAPAKP
jgi:peptidoglycan/xylan/chitin deacetylase (PgdA/CDA1 family)